MSRRWERQHTPLAFSRVFCSAGIHNENTNIKRIKTVSHPIQQPDFNFVLCFEASIVNIGIHRIIVGSSQIALYLEKV
jgi:hypothetical protein